jgi:hypothetical protein
MSLEAQLLFTTVKESPEGTFAVKEFKDRKAANSFRTRLYRVKSQLNDLTVEISVSENSVTAKKSSESSFKLFSPDNAELKLPAGIIT